MPRANSGIEPEAQGEVGEIVETRGLRRGPVDDLHARKRQRQGRVEVQPGAVSDGGVAEVEGGDGGHVDTIGNEGKAVSSGVDESRKLVAAAESSWCQQCGEPGRCGSMKGKERVSLFVCLCVCLLEGQSLPPPKSPVAVLRML